jgi:hypothetical protein
MDRDFEPGYTGKMNRDPETCYRNNGQRNQGTGKWTQILNQGTGSMDRYPESGYRIKGQGS